MGFGFIIQDLRQSTNENIKSLITRCEQAQDKLKSGEQIYVCLVVDEGSHSGGVFYDIQAKLMDYISIIPLSSWSEVKQTIESIVEEYSQEAVECMDMLAMEATEYMKDYPNHLYTAIECATGIDPSVSELILGRCGSLKEISLMSIESLKKRCPEVNGNEIEKLYEMIHSIKGVSRLRSEE